MKFIFVFSIAFNVFLLSANSAKVKKPQVPADEANEILLVIVNTVKEITNSGLEFVKELSTTVTDDSALEEAISDTESAQTQLLAVAASIVPNGQFVPALPLPDLNTVPAPVASVILKPVVSNWLTVLALIYEQLLNFNFIQLPQNFTTAINNALVSQDKLLDLLDQLPQATVQKRQVSPAVQDAVEGLVEPQILLIVNGVRQTLRQLASVIPSDSPQSQIFNDTSLIYKQLITDIENIVPADVRIPPLLSIQIPGLSSLDSTQVQTILRPVVLFLFQVLSPILNGVLNLDLIQLPENVINDINQVFNQNQIIAQL